MPLCQRGIGRKGGAVSQDPTWGKGKTQEVTQGLWGRQVACGAPGQTLGELPEGEGPLPRGGQGTPSWLFLPTVFPTNPSPPYHSRPPAHSPTRPATSCHNSWPQSTLCIREGSSPLTPEGGSGPFPASPLLLSLCPHPHRGDVPEPLEGELS